jgi:hypothetical protein
MENEFLDQAQLDKLKAAAEEVEKKKNEKKEKKEARKAKRKKLQPTGKATKPNAFVQILNGDFLSKEFILNNLNFIFFLIFLLILLVAKGYYGKQLSTDVIKTQRELDELTSDFFEAKARLEEKTRRMELVEKLEKTGLRETVNPTKVIRIKETK